MVSLYFMNNMVNCQQLAYRKTSDRSPGFYRYISKSIIFLQPMH